MVENPTNVGQIGSEVQTDTSKKALIYRHLRSFDKTIPGYDRARHLELSKRGGRARKPATRALVRLLSRSQKEYARGICKVSYRQAYTFYALLLDIENFRSFTRNELFELLSLMRLDFRELVKDSAVRDKNGKITRLMKAQRQEAIAQKTRQLELLLKVGKTFFPELRESFSLNFIKSDAPLSDPTLKLVNPPIDTMLSHSSTPSEKSKSSGMAAAPSTPERVADGVRLTVSADADSDKGDGVKKPIKEAEK